MGGEGRGESRGQGERSISTETAGAAGDDGDLAVEREERGKVWELDVVFGHFLGFVLLLLRLLLLLLLLLFAFFHVVR